MVTTMPVAPIPTKRCPVCGQRKALTTGFYADKGRPDGRKTTCKACENARTIENRKRRRRGEEPLGPIVRVSCVEPEPALADPPRNSVDVIKQIRRKAFVSAARVLISQHQREFDRYRFMFTDRPVDPVSPGRASMMALEVLIEENRNQWAMILREHQRQLGYTERQWVSALA